MARRAWACSKASVVGTYYSGFPDANPTDRFQFWLDRPPSAIVLDVETISLDEKHPLGFGIAVGPDEAFYFDLQEPDEDKLKAITPWLQDIRIRKLAHNWMFDMAVFPLIPVVGKTLNRTNLWDTNVAARLLGYQETALPMLAMELFQEEIASAQDILHKHSAETMMGVPRAEVATHCLSDVRICYRLYLLWREKIEQQYHEYFQVEMRVIPILIDMSMRGVAIDHAARQELVEKYTKEIEFYREQSQAYGIENPGSAQQVGYMLGKRGNFLPLTRSKRQLSTREADLEFLDDPMATVILGYRHNSKFKSTYLDPMEGADRFYTEYYMDTVVGRLNSRNRNIQNIPKDARYMMLPDHGVFTTGDYSQEHLYILAQVSQDRDMLKVMYHPDKKKRDIHLYTAEKMGVTRPLAKTLNYAVVYGATAKVVSEQAKIKDTRRCQRLIEDWFRTFKGAADWIRGAQEEGLRTGWALPTLFKRKIRLPLENDDAMKRKAVNYPILGSDGEVIKRAILLCQKRGLGPPVMAITVHDSISWDGDVADRLPVEELEHIPGYQVPFEVKQTLRWE